MNIIKMKLIYAQAKTFPSHIPTFANLCTIRMIRALTLNNATLLILILQIMLHY